MRIQILADAPAVEQSARWPLLLGRYLKGWHGAAVEPYDLLLQEIPDASMAQFADQVTNSLAAGPIDLVLLQPGSGDLRDDPHLPGRPLLPEALVAATAKEIVERCQAFDVPRVGLMTYAPLPPGAACAPDPALARQQILKRAVRALAAGPGSFLCEIERSLLSVEPIELRALVVPSDGSMG